MTDTAKKLAVVSPPGEFIQEELDARGWIHADLVEVLGVDKRTVSELISGKRSISPEIAVLIGEAFGTSPNVWLSLDAEYQLHKASISRKMEVNRKAKLYGKYPIREMAKRGWIQKPDDTDGLAAELSRFFAHRDRPCAARKTEDDSKLPLQLAWLHRTYNIADEMRVDTYSDIKLAGAVNELHSHLISRDGINLIPEILRGSGIRFIVNQWLPRSKIDGVCFWLDSKSPVVAVSLRFDRIDNFWFTLMHELCHVRYGHAKDAALLDIGMEEKYESISDEERQADEGAQEFLIPQQELSRFVARVSPAFTPAQIRGFARRMRVHPGIVVGQLHHRGVLDHKYHRKMLVPVRKALTSTATYDGWGMIA